MNAIFAGLVVMCATLPVLAAAPVDRTYGVVSLIGDRLVVMRVQRDAGAGEGRNVSKAYALPDDLLDRTARTAADRALRASDPRARPVILSASDPDLLARQEQHVRDGSPVNTLLEPVLAVARREGVTHLVAISKHRAPLRVKAGRSTIEGHYRDGLGWVWGLGFQVNPYADMEVGGVPIAGYVAPFAYFKASLVDVANGTLLGERVATTAESRSRPAGEIRSADPWTQLSAEDKVAVLQAMVDREVSRLVAALVAP